MNMQLEQGAPWALLRSEYVCRCMFIVCMVTCVQVSLRGCKRACGSKPSPSVTTWTLTLKGTSQPSPPTCRWGSSRMSSSSWHTNRWVTLFYHRTCAVLRAELELPGKARVCFAWACSAPSSAWAHSPVGYTGDTTNAPSAQSPACRLLRRRGSHSRSLLMRFASSLGRWAVAQLPRCTSNAADELEGACAEFRSPHTAVNGCV